MKLPFFCVCKQKLLNVGNFKGLKQVFWAELRYKSSLQVDMKKSTCLQAATDLGSERRWWVLVDSEARSCLTGASVSSCSPQLGSWVAPKPPSMVSVLEPSTSSASVTPPPSTLWIFTLLSQSLSAHQIRTQLRLKSQAPQHSPSFQTSYSENKVSVPESLSLA